MPRGRWQPQSKKVGGAEKGNSAPKRRQRPRAKHTAHQSRILECDPIHFQSYLVRPADQASTTTCCCSFFLVEVEAPIPPLRVHHSRYFFHFPLSCSNCCISGSLFAFYYFVAIFVLLQLSLYVLSYQAPPGLELVCPPLRRRLPSVTVVTSSILLFDLAHTIVIAQDQLKFVVPMLPLTQLHYLDSSISDLVFPSPFVDRTTGIACLSRDHSLFELQKNMVAGRPECL